MKQYMSCGGAKRIFSVLLCLMLILGILTPQTFAVTDENASETPQNQPTAFQEEAPAEAAEPAEAEPAEAADPAEAASADAVRPTETEKAVKSAADKAPAKPDEASAKPEKPQGVSAPDSAGAATGDAVSAGQASPLALDVLTINDGNATNNNVPIYGWYADAYQESQFVIPAADLEEITDSLLTNMRFYAATPADAEWGVTFQVYVGSYDSTTLSEFADYSGHTKVYEGVLDGTGATMDVAFNSPFVYTGGNLLVTFASIDKGTYNSISWSGASVTGAGISRWSYSSPDTVENVSKHNFAPKLTITCSRDHTHHFTYSADGATIIASCDADGCYLPENKVTLTLKAPTMGADEATLEGLAAFNAVTGQSVSGADIRYVGRGDTTYPEDAAAPVTPGTYTAKLTVGDAASSATAAVDYEILQTRKYTFALKDAYGDGWGGSYVQVKAPDGTVVGNLTLANGASELVELYLLAGVTYQVIYYTGGANWLYETSFKLYDEYGELLFATPEGTSSSSGEGMSGYANGELLYEIEVPPACSNHVLYLVDGEEPTCTEDGSIAHYHCDACGCNYSDEEGKHLLKDDELVIPAGHDWSDWTYVGEIEGVDSHSRICARCSAEETAACVFSQMEDGVGKGICTLCGHAGPSLVSGEQTVAFWDFETDPVQDGWELVDADEDGNNWYYLYQDEVTLKCFDHGHLTSASYDNVALTPDNWAWSPEFSLVAAQSAEVSLWAAGQDGTYSQEIFAIYAVGSDNWDDVVKISDDIRTTSQLKEYKADLSAFVGQTVRIAIRHYNCTDMFRLNIDNVGIKATFAEPCAAGAHTLTEVPAAEATCTYGAHTEPFWRCETCGRFFSDAAGEHPAFLSDFTSGSPLGHDWGDWEETSAPTCTAAGVETSVCARCQAERTRETPPTGHSFTTVAYDGNDQHTKTCSVCQTVVTEPCAFETIIEGGVQKRTCTLCGNTHIEEADDAFVLKGWRFESDKEIKDWIFLDVDDDDFNWGRADRPNYAYEGSGVLYSESYSFLVNNDSNDGRLYPDNWAISPAFSLEYCTAAELSVWAMGENEERPAEVFTLYAGTSPDPDEMVVVPSVWSDDITTTNEYQKYTLDLSSFLGEPVVYFAIRHHDCFKQFRLLVDDVRVTVTYLEPCEAGEHTLEPISVVGDDTYYRCAVCGRYYLNNAQTPIMPSEILFPVAVADSVGHGTLTPSLLAAHAGDPITVTVAPEEGYLLTQNSLTYTIEGEDPMVIEPTAGVYTFDMPFAPVTLDAEFEVENYFAGHNLTLEGDIGVNFFVKLYDADRNTAKVVLSWGEGSNAKTETVVLKDLTAEENGFRVTAYVAACQMTDTVTARLYEGNTLLDESQYSVAEYARYVLSATDDDLLPLVDNNDERIKPLQNLCEAMLRYGAKAQVQFGYRTDDLADAGLEAMEFDVPEGLGSNVFPEDLESVCGISYYGSSLLLNASLVYRLYFTISDQDKLDALTVTMNDQELQRGTSGSYVYFDVPSLAAAELLNEHTVHFGALEATVNAAHYIHNALTNGADPLPDTVTALYHYSLAANEYFR